MKIRYELAHDTAELDFDPGDYDDCETPEQLMEALEESALEQMSHGAECISHDRADLWETVEQYRQSRQDFPTREDESEK